MQMRKSSMWTVVAGLALLASPMAVHAGTCGSCGWGEKSNESVAYQDKKSDTIVGVAKEAGNFNTLIAAVKAAGLKDALMGDGPLTVLAPSDDAFAKLPSGTVESLLKPENRGKLQAILQYHVIPGKAKAENVIASERLDTLLGQDIAVKVKDGAVHVGSATVTATDIKASNGVIHVIDRVLMPASVVELAAGSDQFTILAKAIKAAGLVDALNSQSAITVFAPTDEAFAKLPAGTLQTLLKPENRDQLRAILTYHVTPGNHVASEVVSKKQVPTLSGQPLAIRTKSSDNGTQVHVGNAQVIATDVKGLNGVIHVIDTVLLPPAQEADAGDPAQPTS